MEIRKFKYKNSLREVIVTDENSTSLKGYDISHLDKEDVKEAWRVKTKDLDMSKLTEEQQKEEYKKLSELMKCFRHFKKNQIV
jgi:hypothetical protein